MLNDNRFERKLARGSFKRRNKLFSRAMCVGDKTQDERNF